MCEWSYGIQKPETGKNIYHLSSCLEFCSSVFVSVTLDFYTLDDAIHLVGMPVGNTSKCSFIVSLGSTDLN